MRMIRFREDILDGEDLIWRKGYIYQILYENEQNLWLDTDSISNQSYAIDKSSLNSCCFLYNCNGEVNANCRFCKGLAYSQNTSYCTLNKGVG